MSGEPIALCGGLGCREGIYAHEKPKYCDCRTGVPICSACERCARCEVVLIMRKQLSTKHVGVKDKDDE